MVSNDIYEKVIILIDRNNCYVGDITTYHTNLVLWKTDAFSTNWNLVHEAVQFSCL